MFKKAVRKKIKLKLALMGAPGGGKTCSALRLAKGLCNKTGGRVAVIDTEANGSDMYAEKANLSNGDIFSFDFDNSELKAPYTVQSYVKAIKNAEESGYSVLIIDSLSHAWAGGGGILERVEDITRTSTSKNSFQAWNKGTREQNILIDTILNSNMHIICTLRCKLAYEQVSNGKGGSKISDIGLAPVQREGLEYEFSMVFNVDQISHFAIVKKDRTSLFNNDEPFLITEKTGSDIYDWLEQGVEELGLDEKTIGFMSQVLEDATNKSAIEEFYKCAIKDNHFNEKQTKQLIEICKKRKKELLEIEEDINM